MQLDYVAAFHAFEYLKGAKLLVEKLFFWL